MTVEKNALQYVYMWVHIMKMPCEMYIYANHENALQMYMYVNMYHENAKKKKMCVCMWICSIKVLLKNVGICHRMPFTKIFVCACI